MSLVGNGVLDLQGELHVCVSKAACRLGMCCLTRRGTASDMVCSCVRSALAIGWGLGQGALVGNGAHLAADRSISVVKTLIEGGMTPESVSAASYGEHRPIASNETREEKAANRRIENRLAGADANPYLAIAASLACGLLGIEQKLNPGAPEAGSAYHLPFALPRN